MLFSHEIRAADRERERMRRRISEAAEKEERTRKIGAIAVVGIAALIGGGYLIAGNDDPDPVVASCVRSDQSGTQTVVADSHCTSSGAGGTFRGKTSTTWPQYHYYYGGTARIGEAPSGGSTLKPANVEIKTKSGAVIQRGGLGRGGGSGS
ncbi:hypothetical protein [Nocardia neocaledoniensis]|uniref:hypothetical protein n=1 Tax=Nocardia neocaledoniensis TaxID=236511 RepID=UPI0024575116|nr:hypothetical protein [Nocardia neocaledoniensis]